MATSDMPCVIYESPHALSDTLELLEGVLEADRLVVAAKELTKIHERVFRGNIHEARELFAGEVKGE